MKRFIFCIIFILMSFSLLSINNNMFYEIQDLISIYGYEVKVYEVKLTASLVIRNKYEVYDEWRSHYRHL